MGRLGNCDAPRELEEQQILIGPALLLQRLVRALLQRLRPADEHQALAWLSPCAVLEQQRCADAAPEALPVVRALGQRIEKLAPVRVVPCKAIQVFLAKDVLDEPVSIENHARRWVFFVLHNSPEDLEDGRDARATTDHEEAPDCPLAPIDGAHAAAYVFELAYWAFHLHKMAYWDGI